MSTLQFIVSWVFAIFWFFLAFIFIFGVQPWWVSAVFFIAGYLALSKINGRVKSELDVSSPHVVYLNQIVETGTMRQQLYMKGDSNEHAQER